jgi:DNA-binding NtrC family response regulator
MLETVLFVDSDPVSLEHHKLITQGEAYEVRTAGSGLEGLAALRRGQVDVVVIDEQLSGLNSSAFLARVCASYPRVVRVMLASETGLSFAVRAMRDGTLYRFVAKPIDAEELRRTIREAIAMKQLAERGESVRPGMFMSWSSG